MVAAINVRTDISGVQRLLNSIAAKTPATLAQAVLKGALYAEGEIKRTLYDETDGRGELARSFHSRFVGFTGGDISAEAYSEKVYARIQEDGGVIRPKTRRALAVPLRMAKVTRGKWPRHYPQEGPQALHFIPRRGRAPLLAQVKKNAKGETVSVKPLFVLLRSVTIKPKRYVARTAERIGPEVQRIVADALGQAIAEEGGSE